MFTLRTKIAIAKGLLVKRSPIYVQYAVTGDCNLNCRICRSAESRNKERALNLVEIGRLAATLERLRVGIVVLTGGEPFLRSDLPEIIRKFSERGLTVRLQTNGILATEDMIKRIIEAGLKEVTVSLDYLCADKEREVTGDGGFWEKRIKAIILFSNLLPRRGAILGINTVVSRHNLKEIPKIIDFAKRIGFFNSLIPLHVSSGNEEFIIRNDAHDFSFRACDYSDIDRLYARIIEMKREGFNIYNSYRFLRESPEYLKYKKLYWKCASPHLYFAISPGGNFQPCIDIATSVSMLEDGFIRRFYSKEFKNYIANKVSNCPGCLYACWPEISYLCNDISVFLERLVLACKVLTINRRQIQHEDCLRLIHKINESYSH